MKEVLLSLGSYKQMVEDSQLEDKHRNDSNFQQGVKV